MTTVFRCCNGSCRYMEDLRCTLDEITITNGGECKDYEAATAAIVEPTQGETVICDHAGHKNCRADCLHGKGHTQNEEKWCVTGNCGELNQTVRCVPVADRGRE